MLAFCGQNGYGFSAPHNFGMPLHVLTNLRASFSRLPLQTFLYSVKGRERCNSVFLGVLGVSGFCGKKCYDFPNIQSKAETTVFFRRTKVQVYSFFLFLEGGPSILAVVKEAKGKTNIHFGGSDSKKERRATHKLLPEQRSKEKRRAAVDAPFLLFMVTVVVFVRQRLRE